MNSTSSADGANSTFDDTDGSNFPVSQSIDDGASYPAYEDNDGASSYTGQRPSTYYNNNANQDATEIVHEMHLALLYLLSNPEEFKKALNASPPKGATTLDEWNAEIEVDDDDDETESVMTAGTATTPLPFVVFADDAEVVLPQAHTASQLFGIEKIEGIELEAAAGIPALSQLFLRWLALMPSGDHLNIIDPPGLTVMRIAGGRYRVTAAHRAVWTWMNEFASLSFDGGYNEEVSKENSSLQIGDLVTLTIVDVFETDNQGKLLSYCPTFDNRAVKKTNQTSETIKKSSHKFFSMLGKAQKAVAKSEVNKRASQHLNRMGIMQHAKNVAENVKHRVGEAVHQMNSPSKSSPQKHGLEEVTDYKEFEQAISAAEEATTNKNDASTSSIPLTPTTSASRGELYVSEVSTEDEEAAKTAEI